MAWIFVVILKLKAGSTRRRNAHQLTASCSKSQAWERAGLCIFFPGGQLMEEVSDAGNYKSRERQMLLRYIYMV